MRIFLTGLLRGLLQCSMAVARVVVPGIEMAADAFQAKFFLIVIVIEMGCDPVIGDAFRIEIDVAFLAGFIEDNAGGVLEFTLAVPVDFLLVLENVGPEILHSHPHLGPDVCEGALRREMAGGTVGLGPASVAVMH